MSQYNALKQAIEQLRPLYGKNRPGDRSEDCENEKVVDGAGFEPAPSTMPTSRGGVGSANRASNQAVSVKEGVLKEFAEFLRVNRRLAPGTVQHTREDIARYLDCSGGVVSRESIAEYLKGYLDVAPKTYNSQITALRRFVRDYLGKPRLIDSFKMAPVDEVPKTKAPTNTEVRKGFEAQETPRAKALYLFLASTGLRKSEALKLTKDKIQPELRAVIPEHFTRKKRSGVTFYNKETEKWLQRYHQQRNGDRDARVFPISDRQWRKIWNNASEAAGVRITSQRLRVWFSTEMGERMVPDRYVDIFQGRAPRTVLAKHYTGKGLQRLKRIYDKAELTVLTGEKLVN